MGRAEEEDGVTRLVGGGGGGRGDVLMLTSQEVSQLLAPFC